MAAPGGIEDFFDEAARTADDGEAGGTTGSSSSTLLNASVRPLGFRGDARRIHPGSD